jgi:hypothetical protein
MIYLKKQAIWIPDSKRKWASLLFGDFNQMCLNRLMIRFDEDIIIGRINSYIILKEAIRLFKNFIGNYDYLDHNGKQY